jgi:hypothetical protein
LAADSLDGKMGLFLEKSLQYICFGQLLQGKKIITISAKAVYIK